MVQLIGIVLMIAASIEALPVTIDPCADALVDRARLVDALGLELSPRALMVESATTAERSLWITCVDEAALRIELGQVSAEIELATIGAEDRPRVVALAAAELDRVPGQPRWIAPTATVAPAVSSAPPAVEPSSWRLSVRSELLKLLGDPGGVLGVGVLGEQRPAPFGLLLGGSIIGVDSNDETRLGLEVKAGVAFSLFTLGPASVEGELTAGAGVVGILNGKFEPFVLAMVGPNVRWRLPGDGLELLTNVGVALVPWDSWLLQASVGLAWPL